ncbi:DUF2149 domain-containing protein [Aestuariicella hydrocarbonica]|uniref:DUF2149 domain-containing protein n=1 Tax=Pseudomaricurvus hydrocarbonicus TaxID=1470433 RepID=A0A9E5MLY4_9GAMM|nr:DUF2149 domain-containing protein [Aestuariicella hydrocarbonica]NHO64985.1 DUF2149 domain-containing protein [Aestuariicella hydrocarbonica]
MSKRWSSDRFGGTDDEPLGPLANLLDLMLVFACGLIAALIAMSEQLQERFQAQDVDAHAQTVIERGQELPRMPGQGAAGGEGYESVGQVYRDPNTGQLILIAP